MKTLQMIHYFNFVIATVFVVFYFYQIGYLLLGLLMKHRKNKTGSHQFHRYAAVISARNEANVIGGLIASLYRAGCCTGRSKGVPPLQPSAGGQRLCP